MYMYILKFKMKKCAKSSSKIACAILATILLCLIITWAVTSPNVSKNLTRKIQNQEDVCFTPACMKKATQILNNLKPSVNPCDDFYQFVCGNYVDQTNIQNDQPWTNAFTQARNLVYQEVKATLEEVSEPNEFRPLTLAKSFYNSCMDTEAIEKDGLMYIERILDLLGGWPVIKDENWQSNRFEWKKAMYVLRQIGFDANYFLSVTIVRYTNNGSQRLLSINQPVLELEREVYLNDREEETLRNYYDHMVDVAESFCANRTVAEEELKEVLNFEIYLANISYQLHQSKQEFSNVLTLSELRRLFPFTNWKEYIKQYLDIPRLEITGNETIFVHNLQYLNELEELLNKTSLRVQANYVMWRVVSSSLPYLTERLRNLRANFMHSLTGVKHNVPRWKECVNETLYRFWRPLKSLYYRKHFNQNSEKLAVEMLFVFQMQFIQLLQQATWIKDTAKSHIPEKLDIIKMNIKPFHRENDEVLEKYYKPMGFNSENYLRAVLEVARFTNNNYYRSLRDNVSSEEKFEGRCLSFEFDMLIPGGIFNEFFLNPNLPRYTYYGGVNFFLNPRIIGLYDDIWWINNTQKSFKELSQCFIKKYERIPQLKLRLNGKNLLKNNLLDSIGLKTAYLAYILWLEENNTEQQLPGLNYTPQQMFWISLANLYCSKYRPEELKVVSLEDSFIPSYFRIISSFSNSEYFNQDFECTVGSKMNPEVKCEV